ncbi:MAG: HAMP domain-containing histidine kinase [Synergistaceae bacterium]|nr:HAMP domain-containing histidine kinase [Synergistaceae bacterium]
MDIKRRLFFSNILMIVIPLVISLAVFFGGLHFYALLTGLNEEQPGERRRNRELYFMEALDEARAMAEKWQNVSSSAIMEDVAGFNGKHADGRLLLAVYKDNVPFAGTPPWRGSSVGQALEMTEPASFFSRATFQTIGDYRIALSSGSRVARSPQNYKDIMRKGAAVSLICSVFIILITNRFLTRFVFKRIVHGMDTLAHGVYQVRDGNLDFRIDYRENDEFSQVCGEFNEMAAKLLESVEARRKDERSRKELIAGISHDLRTPLTSIKAYVEGLEQGVAATPEARERYMGTIKNKTADLEHIIDNLFLFSKLDTGEFPYDIERVDLAAAVSEIVDALKEEYGNRGLDISPARASGRVYADIDVAQMRCVIINIFENSVKYKDKARGKISVSISEEKGTASLIISDDGPGVPEEALPKLFDVFYRSDESRNNPGQGSGLGLAIAAKMAEGFGGSIKAANVPEGGLSIKMTFPGSDPKQRNGKEKNSHS